MIKKKKTFSLLSFSPAPLSALALLCEVGGGSSSPSSEPGKRVSQVIQTFLQGVVEEFLACHHPNDSVTLVDYNQMTKT